MVALFFIIQHVNKEDIVMTNETISNQYKYDINGNITSIKDGNNITLTYKAKDLETYSDSSKQIYERYYYNDKHLRVKKEILDSNGNVTSTITYTYDNNDNLIYQKQGNISLTFLYDNSNMLYGFIYNGYTYYYIRNILNDILGIVDIQGNQIVEYRYLDAWGNHSVFSRKVIHRSSISDSIIDGTLEIVPNTDPSFIGNINPFRYKGYYYDKETQLYWVSSRYYSPELCRWISPDSIDYLDPESINGLNLYCYCHNNPIMYVDPDGHMPKWAQWVVGGLAIAGLVVATVLTCGVAGAGAAAVGAAMLAGGLVSAGINVVDQLSDGGEFDWTELAISTLSGTAYGLVVGLTGGAGGWAVAGKFAVAGGTSLLNSWNQNATFGETMKSLGISLLVSGAAQGAGYLTGKFGPQLLSKIAPRNPNHLLTMGDIGSALWVIPAVKTGVIRFAGGVAGSIFNNF